MEEILSMSTKELERLRVLQKTLEKELTQKEAADLLNLSDRQVRKLIKKLKIEGAKALISKKRGKPSNRQKEKKFKSHVLNIIQEKYSDFGPTLIQEKLDENHLIKLGKETIRQWMIKHLLWTAKQKKKNLHPLRERKACFGQLIQIDGSHHDWFEGRGPKCVLIVFIDDATSKLTSLHFSEGESLEAYFVALKKHLLKFGRPKELYSDHFSVFEAPQQKDHLTQFKRALNCLDISIRLASSPQAKGRVERANRILQDRLVKEMRLRGISSIEEANRFLGQFISFYNHKFSKEPASTFDAHRSLEPRTPLSRILSRYEERTVLKDLSFQFHNTYYQILQQPSSLQGKKIEVRLIHGKMCVFLGDKKLKVRELMQIKQPERSKDLILNWKEERGVKSQPSWHPWKSHNTKEQHLRNVV